MGVSERLHTTGEMRFKFGDEFSAQLNKFRQFVNEYGQTLKGMGAELTMAKIEPIQAATVVECSADCEQSVRVTLDNNKIEYKQVEDKFIAPSSKGKIWLRIL